jgi:hypothetical protein
MTEDEILRLIARYRQDGGAEAEAEPGRDALPAAPEGPDRAGDAGAGAVADPLDAPERDWAGARPTADVRDDGPTGPPEAGPTAAAPDPGRPNEPGADPLGDPFAALARRQDALARRVDQLARALASRQQNALRRGR